ncbi:hypothetical protein QZH41_003413 [Actinostola sp. cb2023]|nr:hypothetical protein QZH41_003413 [Actinostola sp. cb2023]
MFYGQLAETRPTIDLPDCTKEGLHELLRYVHSDEVTLNGSNVMEVLYLADKYMMPFLADKCRTYFKKEVKPEHLFSILPEVSEMGDQELEQHCWDIVDTETQSAVSSQRFLDSSIELICQVLARDGLRIKEVSLFQAVDRWVSKQIQEKGVDCNGETKRAVLGEEVIRLIRFPLMSQKEFAEAVLPTKILKLDEVTELIQVYNNLPAVTSLFSTKERSAKDRLLIPNNRFDSIRTESISDQYSSIIEFRVNKAITLVGVRLFGSEGCSHDVILAFQEVERSPAGTLTKRLWRYRSTFKTEENKIDGFYYGFTVFFPDQVKLDPNCDGDKVTIPANKYILAISSPVFEAMFYGQLAETRPTIDLPDCTKEGLHELLRYMHSDEVTLTGSNVMEVLYLADKYMMPFLADKCRRYFKKEVKPENVFSILPEVSKMGDQELEQHCWDIVDTETQSVVSSAQFLDSSNELICQVLARDGLRIKEVSLFQAVDRWVSKQIQEKGVDCSGETKRAVLGEEVIRLIRFPLMSQKEFAEAVLPTKVLKLDEVTELIQVYSNLPAVTSLFSTKERSAKDRLLIPNNRFDSIRTESISDQYSSIIEFRVNKAITLVGVRLFGSEGYSHDVILAFHEVEGSPAGTLTKRLWRYRSTFKTEENKIDGFYYGFTVFFPDQVKLDPSKRYQIVSVIMDDCPNMHVGCHARSVVTCEDLEVTYLRSRVRPVFVNQDRDSLEGGQIQTLIFKDIK